MNASQFIHDIMIKNRENIYERKKKIKRGVQSPGFLRNSKEKVKVAYRHSMGVA